jgi:hypothetical protein
MKNRSQKKAFPETGRIAPDELDAALPGRAEIQLAV